MDFRVRVESFDAVAGPMLAVAVKQTGKRVPAALKDLDAASDGVVGRAIRGGDFSGATDESVLLYPPEGPTRIVLVGLGRSEQVTRAAIRRAASVAGRKAVAAKVPKLTFGIAGDSLGGVTTTHAAQAAVEGLAQGAWSFGETKAAADPVADVGSATLLVIDPTMRNAAVHGVERGSAIAAGQAFARRLQALPGNVCTPSYLADTAIQLGRDHDLKVTVLDLAGIKRHKMGALLAVAAGSREEPRFIVLEYKGGKGAPVCLVGKGVTFDSGGISIKPALSMEEMKYDMSGAAAVLGTFHALGRIRPELNVVGIIPATENLPSGTATKPGDIVKSHLGKTIEVVNTDAEGRLILADALSYARRFKPACVLDAATLTGAVVIGLGHEATAIMGNDDALVEEVKRAGDAAGERCWPLPMWEEYHKQIESDFADVKNVGGKPAGTITAAWFLREFVEGFPWVHLDIAGTAYLDSDRAYVPRGPTGVGVRIFSQLILERAS